MLILNQTFCSPNPEIAGRESQVRIVGYASAVIFRKVSGDPAGVAKEIAIEVLRAARALPFTALSPQCA
jgi:hypothetical protein